MINRLRLNLEQMLAALELDPERLQINRPTQYGRGDLTSNAPLVYAKAAHRSPMDLGQEMMGHLELDREIFAQVDLAPPGFLNFTFTGPYLQAHTRAILAEGNDFGKGVAGRGKRAMVEFVSANPTGPLTVGHGRGAILGDTVANLLAWNGYEVEREYYYNDAGRQMRVLGQSVQARYLELLGKPGEFPEDGYQGAYIIDIARNLMDQQGDQLVDADHLPFTAAAEQAIFQDINGTLEKLGIHFDTYFNERDLYKSGAVEKTVAALKERDLAYEKEGATWLKGTALGRPDDRVLIKGTGEPTYRLPDIAYHADKLKRGYDLAVDIFGADHMDTYPDVLAGLHGLGLDPAPIRVLIHQFVTITRAGQQVKMSTRKATFVTLEELMEEVGRDVVRYFFLMRGMDTHLKFDLALATKTSDENPIYYLQYAHARMVNIARRAESFGYTFQPDTADLALLELPEERGLMHLLWWFPRIIAGTLDSLEPQIVANYLQELATAYHRYYTVARVVTDDEPVSQARLVLTAACRQAIYNGLAILGISAPERM